MKFIKKVLEAYRNYKREFFSVNQVELTGFSKALMILFFFTALWLIANGIGSSIHQSTPPEEKYSYKCEQFAQIDHFTIFDFQKPPGKYRNSYYDFFGKAPQCQKVQKGYEKILSNHRIQSEILQIRKLEEQIRSLSLKQRQLKEQYSSMLLEKVSKQSPNKSFLNANADTVKERLAKLRSQKENLNKVIAQKKDLTNYPEIQEFISLRDKYADQILDNLSFERKFYRLKISLQVFAFVIPIWLLFYFFYRFFAKREKHIFAKLSFYVASAAALYGLIELIQLIYSIIPRLFLAKLIAFFTSHNMIIVLNVLGILFFLTLFGIIIHKIQQNQAKKRVLKDTKTLNVKRECCFNCGSKRSPADEYCGFCGEKLKTSCLSCNHEIYRYAPFCTACGVRQNDKK